MDSPPPTAQLLGEYGLRCKREIWRAQLALAKVRSAARKLLTLDEKDPKRLFEGDALIRRLVRFGILSEDEKRLDDVLRLSTQRFLERRLQTKVYKMNYAKSIHHARVLIRQRHIRVGKQLVDSPSFMVRSDSVGHIDFALHSPYNPATGRPVRFFWGGGESRARAGRAGGADWGGRRDGGRRRVHACGVRDGLDQTACVCCGRAGGWGRGIARGLLIRSHPCVERVIVGLAAAGE